MFLVAQSAGKQGEFQRALGSWDVIRDARRAWHSDQPRMAKSTVQVGRGVGWWHAGAVQCSLAAGSLGTARAFPVVCSALFCV